MSKPITIPSSRVDHPPSAHRPLRVALLGCGTVGREVARVLLEEGRARGLELVRVLVRDASRGRGLPERLEAKARAQGVFVTSLERVLEAKPELAIEAIGGLGASLECVRTLLERGVHVVTANKTLIAHHAEELRALAAARGARLRHEAAVAAGVPLFAALHQLRGDRVTRIRGVINGSCNYILTRMERTGETLAEAIRGAAIEGLVEPDPSADTSGRDSAEKLCVLAGELGLAIGPWDVRTTGIEGIQPDDLRAARRDGRAIRLVAELEVGGAPEGEEEDGRARWRASVSPTLLARTDVLATLPGAENAIEIDAQLAGRVVLRGLGAGPKPTASAILGDVHAIASGIRKSRSDPGGREHEAEATETRPPARARREQAAARPVACLIRWRTRRAIEPARLLGALRDRGVEAREVSIEGPVARITTAPIDEVEARAWVPGFGGFAGDGTGEEGVPLLVLPIADDERSTPRGAQRLGLAS